MSQRESIRGRFNLVVTNPAWMVLIGLFVILSFLMTGLAPADESVPGEALKITRITPSGADIHRGGRSSSNSTTRSRRWAEWNGTLQKYPFPLSRPFRASGDG